MLRKCGVLRHITMPNFFKTGPSIAGLLRFSKWPPLLSWIFEIAKFYWLTGYTWSRHTSMPKIVNICQSAAKVLRFFSIFQDGGRRRLGFLKSWILLANKVLRVETHQHDKFSQNRSIGWEDIKIFWFFAILYLFGAPSPSVSTLRSLSLCKI